jgi:hypothetical protein
MKVPHGKPDPTSSEHRTRIPVIDVGGEPDGQFVLRCFPIGISFHRPSREGRGPDGTGRERALRAPVNYFGCLFCCLGPLCVRDLNIFGPGQILDVEQ